MDSRGRGSTSSGGSVNEDGGSLPKANLFRTDDDVNLTRDTGRTDTVTLVTNRLPNISSMVPFHSVPVVAE